MIAAAPGFNFIASIAWLRGILAISKMFIMLPPLDNFHQINFYGLIINKLSYYVYMLTLCIQYFATVTSYLFSGKAA